MRHGSLFSGIGGFDLASQWMGWENIFHCEWNEFGQKVLKYYWPKAISYHDITKTDFTIHRGSIDILTGGFPCQPYSAAGKRLGKEDDRHLWPEMLRAIREIQPAYIVAENVRGLTNWNGGLVFNEVQAEMEAEGYEVTPFLLPACAVNAPHRRDRIWFVAYANDNGQRKSGFRKSEGSQEQHGISRNGGDVSRRELWNEEMGQGGTTPDTPSDRRERTGQGTEGETGKEGLRQGGKLEGGFEGLRNIGATPDTISPRCQTEREQSKPTTQSERIGNSRSRWERFPTQSPICRGDDGLSSRLSGITFPKWRNESIKAYGNAIVPQVAFEIFKAIE